MYPGIVCIPTLPGMEQMKGTGVRESVVFDAPSGGHAPQKSINRAEIEDAICNDQKGKATCKVFSLQRIIPSQIPKYFT
ncbi:hypothetical protein CDAR_489211 [Caerostris darwini]|uniref:Uncharacterized protein n=1 Tax=Caerostris darwini TaxID=1538125 RepID=A0AAV4T237_9ARAC|nr:hypothetical protein CDAR_489211 [Caerostris darwini]